MKFKLQTIAERRGDSCEGCESGDGVGVAEASEISKIQVSEEQWTLSGSKSKR